MQRKFGFTLLEMMVVVAIIAVIAAIAIPNLLRARLQANESAAIETLRTISQAQVTLHADRETFGDFDALTTPGQGPAFLDASWEEGEQRAGYAFSIAEAGPNSYTAFADPVEPGTSGRRFFRVDTSGILRYSNEGRPDVDGLEIGTVAGG
jgi:prepilin-type N-terminal cleavage/methylation domain-containing protein